MSSMAERSIRLKDETGSPSTPKADEKVSTLSAKKFKVDRPCSPNRDAAAFTLSMASPMGKYHTPQKSRAEIACLKSEVDELRSQLREESVRKKAVLKDIEQQTRQLQASEARLRVMETKLKELAQSKHALSMEKASSDKELLNLKVKWDAASKKLDKIHETVARTHLKISTVDKERSKFEQKSNMLSAELMREMDKKKSLEARCIELTERLSLAHRQVDQLTHEVTDTKKAQEEMLDKEETQSEIYSLACTISNLRSDLEAEMNYSSQRKTELALAIAEKERLETLLFDSRAAYDSSVAAWDSDREQMCHKASSAESQLESFKNEFSRFQESQMEEIEKSKDVITSLNEEIALRDANMIECEGRYRELERAFENLTNERDSKLREIELLEDEIKSKQLENRRMDERVNFLESAMDYLRGEMSEKLSELDDLKAASAQLYDQLSQASTDLHSALQSQATLKDSLDKADEKIEELERMLTEVRYEKLALAQNLEVSNASYSVEKDSLLQELTAARAAHDTAKADLEDLRTELEAGRAALTNHTDLLSHKEAIHAALVSAHDALIEKQKSLDESASVLRQENHSLNATIAEKEVLLKEQHTQLVDSQAKFEREAQELEHSISGLNQELSSSLASIEEQKTLVSALQGEVESLRQAEVEGESRIVELETSLSQSSAAVTSLTLRNDSLTTEVTTLKGQLDTALVSAFDLMKAKTDQEEEAADRESNHLDAQKSYINQIAELQTSLRTQVDSTEAIRADLEKKVSIVEECFTGKLESASHKYQRELEETQGSFESQIAKLEALLAEKSGIVARKVEEIESFVARVNTLESKIADQSRIAESKDQQIEQFEAHVKKLETSGLDFEKTIETLGSRVSEADQLVSHKDEQLTQLHAQIANIESTNSEEAARIASQIELLESRLSESAQLSNDKDSQLERLEAQILQIETLSCEQVAQIEKMKFDADATHQVHYEQMATLHTSMAELKRELSEMEASKSAQVEEMRSKYLSVSSALASARDRVSGLEKDKSDLEESELTLNKSLIAEREARQEDLSAKDAEVQAALIKARALEDQLSEMQVEKSGLKSSLAKVEIDLSKYKAEMSETDAVLALSQAECDDLKKERKHWMQLAEQQKTEMESSFRLLKDAQDEVESVTAKCDQLGAKYAKLKQEKADEEKAEADLRVKKLSHEVRMMTAELTRNKNRVATRDAAIQAGKSREEKLQTNLDAQIEKSRDLQRQLSDRDRETIIERGRAKSVGNNKDAAKPQIKLRSNKESEDEISAQKGNSEEVDDSSIPTLDEYHDLVTQLATAKAEIAKMNKQLEVEKTQIDGLIADQTKLTGHNNPKQKIQFTHKLMTENHELKLERANLLAQLEKKGFDSPHRKSLTRSIVAKVRPGSTTISTPGAKEGENAAPSANNLISLTASAPLSQKAFGNGLNTSIDAENMGNLNM